MYIILVYDIVKPKTSAKVLKFLRQHLMWVQNSVFEGELSESRFAIIKSTVKGLIDIEKDSIIYYVFDSKSYIRRAVIGVDKNELSTII
jgi:CRISPR-associated protein Cas2